MFFVIHVHSQEIESILASHAMGDVVLSAKEQPLNASLRKTLVDILADHMIHKYGR